MAQSKWLSFPLNSMVDLSIVRQSFTRGYFLLTSSPPDFDWWNLHENHHKSHGFMDFAWNKPSISQFSSTLDGIIPWNKPSIFGDFPYFRLPPMVIFWTLRIVALRSFKPSKMARAVRHSRVELASIREEKQRPVPKVEVCILYNYGICDDM